MDNDAVTTDSTQVGSPKDTTCIKMGTKQEAVEVIPIIDDGEMDDHDVYNANALLETPDNDSVYGDGERSMMSRLPTLVLLMFSQLVISLLANN